MLAFLGKITRVPFGKSPKDCAMCGAPIIFWKLWLRVASWQQLTGEHNDRAVRGGEVVEGAAEITLGLANLRVSTGFILGRWISPDLTGWVGILGYGSPGLICKWALWYSAGLDVPARNNEEDTCSFAYMADVRLSSAKKHPQSPPCAVGAEGRALHSSACHLGICALAAYHFSIFLPHSNAFFFGLGTGISGIYSLKTLEKRKLQKQEKISSGIQSLSSLYCFFTFTHSLSPCHHFMTPKTINKRNSLLTAAGEKLNFDAPLLSVRRFSGTSSIRDRNKLKKVTEPVAVPFVWEQIPGKAKGCVEHEFEPDKEALCTPRLPPGRISKVMKCPVKKSVAFYPAMAMTLETPKYASRKQSVAPEQPREVKKVVVGDRKSPINQYESAIVPYYNQDVDEEEIEDKYDDDYQDSGDLSRKACGLLPRLCFKSSLGLLNPVPGLKLRTHSSMSSTREIVKPRKATYSKSRTQIVEKNAWDAVRKNKSDRGVQSAELPGTNQIVQFKHQDSSFLSPRLSKDKPDTEFQHPRLPEIGKELICVSNQFSSSNDQQMVNRSPPERLPCSGRISPYRRERPSPFRGGVLYQSTGQGSGSPSPAVEKTSYVDSVNSSDTKVLEESIAVKSSLEDIKGLNVLDGKGISEYEIAGSVKSSRSSFSDKLDPGQNRGLDHCRFDYSPLPPPLPKMPSESWLWRALPSRNYRQSYNGTRFKPKKQEPKTPATDAKWETIVKTSYLHHDHVRYSEENTEGIIEFLMLTAFGWAVSVSTWSELVKDFAAAYHFSPSTCLR
ncbi:Xylem bark cysteine peptidase 3 isoform 1 [Hibiscus syriacus]|uniref:Xylem bark cysteine peptidase 3 isoform 1 n=1 Tax=Hibiscus syriacus TaxID=106335 RepID=A0A6A3C7J1_HIBSY|nr:Xylem bark cysteine peptidase 3 isoform 1 [Hibiscus syriacus]